MIKDNNYKSTLESVRVDERIQCIVDKIAKALSPEKIILFGSHAYGNAKKYSDIDLLVILDTPLRPAERVRMVSRLLYPRIAPLDIIVKTPAEILKAQSQIDPFLHEILEKGIPVYARR